MAGFIGTPAMNIVPGTLEDGTVRLAGGTVVGTGPAGPRRALSVGIRPEHLMLAAEGLALQVDLVEPLGSETLVHGRMADGTALLCKLPGAVPVADRITVAADPAALHLFDAGTGERV